MTPAGDEVFTYTLTMTGRTCDRALADKLDAKGEELARWGKYLDPGSVFPGEGHPQCEVELIIDARSERADSDVQAFPFHLELTQLDVDVAPEPGSGDLSTS